MPDRTYAEGKTAELRGGVTAWEQAENGSQRERDAAEAFTRAWAELHAYLAGGGELPPEWAAAHPPLHEPVGDIPHVRVYVQDTAGAWWLPGPGAAIIHMLQAATADTTMAAVTVEERSRILDAMDELADAIRRKDR